MTNKKLFFSNLTGKFFFRSFISYVLLIALVMISLYLLFQGETHRFFLASLESHLNRVGLAMKDQILLTRETNDKSALQDLIFRMGAETGLRITVIEPDGAVAADSQHLPSKMENHRDRPEVQRALKGFTHPHTRYSSTIHQQMLYLAIPIEKNNQVALVLRLSVYDSAIRSLFSALRNKFLWVSAFVLVFALLCAWWFSRSIAKPVRDIVRATREFADGNFNTKVYIHANNELAHAGRSFNTMVAAQKNLFDELNDRREELQAIISSMKEGLLVINANGAITLCNHSFETMVNRSQPEGHWYGETFRIPDFDVYIKRAFSQKESFYEEAEFGGKIYLVGFNPMNHAERIVITFRDITAIKHLESMKKDFVVNLTHELKTPLTAIKGFVETLEEEENIENTQYIEIIKRHTDRMNQIVSDMLTLSELEEPRREISFEIVNLNDLIGNILKIFMEKIHQKGLSIRLNIESGLPPVSGEKFKLEQMFVNLVDNAVKYTEEGYIAISMRANNDARQVEIRILNTCPPIPEQCLPRLFERFYVIDKSRSRRVGGTGLGLAIVKHVVLLHKGIISAENVKGEGVMFTIRLPISIPNGVKIQL